MSRSTDPDSPAPLTPQEAALLASQVAELAKAGLPLGPGLRAMAEDIGGGRLGRMLARVAGHVEAGACLDEAILAEGDRFPPHVGRLVMAGVASGRLAVVLEQLVALRQKRSELRQAMVAAVAYPAVLLTFLVILGAFLGLVVVPQFAKIFTDFGAELPVLTELIISMSGSATWLFVSLAAVPAAGLAVLYLARGWSWARQALYVVPVLGPVERFSGLAALSHLAAVLLDERLPLPAALRLAGEGAGAADLREGCRAAAAHVESGGSLAECCTPAGPLPPSLRPLIAWAEASSNLAEAFRAAAEVFEGRVRVYVALVETIAPPLVFLAVLAAVGVFLAAMFMPLISLIQKLT